MSPSKFPQIPFTLDALVSEIHSILGPDGGIDSEHIDHREIMALMEEYNSKATDWSKYAIFDESRAYTRNLVDDGNGKFNLMILAWTKGQKSPIHDHSGSHCIMKILDGELQETQYEWPSMSGDAAAPSSDITEAVDHADALSDDQNKNNPLAVTQQTVLRPNEVAYINGMTLSCAPPPVSPWDRGLGVDVVGTLC
ncbi:RmlC-like cupin domain-containing protein [Syncephalastrum racemosum]|uniref:Cysteine dioxygenase n=1 Tax=Syncephalastrum racemosum TaxID=13706 RepID=A0A1X2HWN1_SYNRA|nr:RmlC-like cupin domain-containing protein [Syncephalastrum racemosum]